MSGVSFPADVGRCDAAFTEHGIALLAGIRARWIATCKTFPDVAIQWLLTCKRVSFFDQPTVHRPLRGQRGLEFWRILPLPVELLREKCAASTNTPDSKPLSKCHFSLDCFAKYPCTQLKS
jgi:hypothetical protein